MKGSKDADRQRKDGPPDEDERPVPQMREQQRREEKLTRKLAEAEERKVRARERDEESVWFGLGTFGLVGWSVAIPTLIGLALGIWLDSTVDLGFSWTLTLLFAGTIVGCLNAWYWISRERDEIHAEPEPPQEDEERD
jgi:ATP synthase protein I